MPVLYTGRTVPIAFGREASRNIDYLYDLSVEGRTILTLILITKCNGRGDPLR